MSNVWKPNHPRHVTSATHSPQWRRLTDQTQPCKHRLLAIKSTQTMRQKWLIAGKIRWCDYL